MEGKKNFCGIVEEVDFKEVEVWVDGAEGVKIWISKKSNEEWTDITAEEIPKLIEYLQQLDRKREV